MSQRYENKTEEVSGPGPAAIRIPSVTNCARERLDEVHCAGTLIFDYLRDSGLEVRYDDQHQYPAIVAGFPWRADRPGDARATSTWCSRSRTTGSSSRGSGRLPVGARRGRYEDRGGDLVWMKDALRAGPPYPSVNLCLGG